MILSSCEDLLPCVAVTEPARGGVFGKYFWNTKIAMLPLASPVTEFLKLLNF